MLKRYWDLVAPAGAAKPKPFTLGRISDELVTKAYGDQKIAESLQQLAKLHRNPIAHPDVLLSVEEAIETIGLARSIVGSVVRRLPEPLPTASSISELFRRSPGD